MPIIVKQVTICILFYKFYKNMIQIHSSSQNIIPIQKLSFYTMPDKYDYVALSSVNSYVWNCTELLVVKTKQFGDHGKQ